MSAQATGTDAPSHTFTITGVLTELQVAPGTENLLAQIDRHFRAKSIVTGLGAIAGDLYGQVAGAAAVAMYDGEDTENFVCLIGEQVVCGTFGGASKLPIGKEVKAVVRHQGNVLVAEGILSDSEGLVWVRHAWGATAESWANYKIAAYCFCFSMFCISLCIVFLGVNPADSKLASFTWSAAASALLCFGMAWWNSSTMNVLADPATEVFRLLGFADPDKVNLNSYQYGIVHIHELIHTPQTRANYGSIYCYKKALEDGKLSTTSA